MGGGSAIDAAKAIAMMTTHKGGIRPFLEQKKSFSTPGLPIVAIPTTSGTGTEANPFFVIVVKELQEKLSGAPEWAYPMVSILDPELVIPLSARQTASTGLDVIAHAFEALWAKPASPVSDISAFEAIRLTFEWLSVAVANGKNLEAREKMMFACLAAGMALCATRTAACHGVSYPLTVKWGLEHGFACAFTLPDFLDFTWEHLETARTARLMHYMGTDCRKTTVEKLRSFCLERGTPETLGDIGIGSDQINEILEIANYKNIENTVVPVSGEDITNIFTKKL